ncbi:hypothetical protein LguiB_011479 [Lonicera macranthoides]
MRCWMSLKGIWWGMSTCRIGKKGVADRAGTIGVIRMMDMNFELIIVGRQHENRSPLVLGQRGDAIGSNKRYFKENPPQAGHMIGAWSNLTTHADGILKVECG